MDITYGLSLADAIVALVAAVAVVVGLKAAAAPIFRRRRLARTVDQLLAGIFASGHGSDRTQQSESIPPTTSNFGSGPKLPRR